jgi:hypothetical protein
MSQSRPQARCRSEQVTDCYKERPVRTEHRDRRRGPEKRLSQADFAPSARTVNPCNRLLLGRAGSKLGGQCSEGLQAEDDDAGDQRRAGDGRNRRVAYRRRPRGSGDQQESEHERPGEGVGRVGFAVEPVGDAAKAGNRRQRHGKQQGVEGEGVGPEMVGERGRENECDRRQSSEDAGGFGGRQMSPALRSRSQRGGG